VLYFAVRLAQANVFGLRAFACVRGGKVLHITLSGFVSGFALQKVQFKAQMLMAKLAQNPCYMKCRLIYDKAQLKY